MNSTQKLAAQENFERILDFLRESNAIENINNIDYCDINLQKSFRGHFGAFFDAQQLAIDHIPLSVADLQRWQGWVLQEQITFDHPIQSEVIGKIRSTQLPIDINLDQYALPSYKEVPMLIEKMIDDLNNALIKMGSEPSEIDIVLLLGDFHQRFKAVYPFVEGNGIVSRLIINYIMGWFALPYIIFNSDEISEINTFHQNKKLIYCFMGKKIQEAVYNSEKRLFKLNKNFGSSSLYHNSKSDEKIIVEWHELMNSLNKWR